MAKNHEEIEKMMIEMGCVGDRVSASGINQRIEAIEFKVVETCGTKFMYCYIKMNTGFVVNGKPAACIDPANWREEIGQKISFENTFEEIWRLEAYLKCANRAGLPDEQLSCVVQRAKAILDNPAITPEQAHNDWMAEMLADGWAYDPVKNLELKLHPLVLPYGQLPDSIKDKVTLFHSVVCNLCED